MTGEIFVAESFLWSCVWQSTIFLVVGLGGSFILRHRSARAHQVLLVSMIAAVIVPMMSALVKHYELGVFVAEPVVIDLAAEHRTVAGNHETRGLTSTEAIEREQSPIVNVQPAIIGSESAGFSWRLAVLCAWIAVSLFLATRLLVAFTLGVHRLSRAMPLHCAEIDTAARLAKAKLAIDKDVSVCCSGGVRSPVIWCWGRRPVLTLPSAAGQSNNGIDWTGVLCHELAHYKRRDHIAGLLAELTVCILPWHLLLWWAKFRLISLGEQACDDWVVASGQACTDYAESLLDLIPAGQMAFVPAVVSTKRGLAGRIRRILKDKCGNPRTGAIWALAVSIMAVCLAVTVAFAQTRPAEPANAEAQDKAAATAALFRAIKDDYRAIKDEDITLVKSAIAQGADLEAKNSKGYTPLHAVIRQPGSRYKMIKLLLESGANPNARDPDGQIPLHLDVRDWHISTIELLVSAGSDVNARDNKGMRPPMIAFELGNTDMFDLMVAHGATVPTDLMSAYKGDLSQVQSLIENGKAQETFEQGLTVLHAAAAGGHTVIVELLLTNGLDVRSETQAGYTALNYAAANNHLEVAEILLAKGANIDTRPGTQTPLHWAIREKHKDIIDWLLAKGANPNADGGGWASPLHWAVWRPNRQIALLLVSHGGDIHLKTQEYSNSPLYDAVWDGNRNMTKALITKAGDNRAAKWAPFHATVVSGDIQEIEDMLAKGADVKARDEDGCTALFIATLRGHKEVVDLLLARGADINSRLDADARWGAAGWTALHCAARNGRKSIAQLLVAKGADVNVKSKNGQTPLDVAEKEGYNDIVELLRKHEATE